VRWRDIRADPVERAGGVDAVQAAKNELLAEMIGHRLAEVRKARGLTNTAKSLATKSWLASPLPSAVDCTRQSTSTTATSQPSPDFRLALR
jgi:hypothetical protein